MMTKHHTNFPLEVDSRLVRGLQVLILISIKLLACLMALVIIWSVIDVTYIIYQKALNPPFLLVNIEEVLTTFGAFLVVLIAIEIFLNIILYLRKDMSHLRLVVATALMAIARKVIILDYKETSPAHLWGIAGVIAALGLAYWLIHYTDQSQIDVDSSGERPA
ncbi:phosphate-starvation-inducible PsiE family protein [Candidatus Protochlamydia naegleriophila]|nr:phosphate-starvation-inducible PsiE family protein [Candidatus Protochlamydia naegleriophila]